MSSISDLIRNLFYWISDAVSVIVNAVTYPFLKLFEIFQSFIVNIWDSLHSLVVNLVDLFALVTGFVYDFFVGIFPSTWTALFMASLTLVIALRIYYFLKGVSIAGFSV